jgi:hypothetical protein
LEEGTGVEPASDRRAVVFGTTALPVRLPFQGISDCGLRISNWRAESDNLSNPHSEIRNPKSFGARGRTCTYVVTRWTPDLQSGAFAAQPHVRAKNLLC